MPVARRDFLNLAVVGVALPAFAGRSWAIAPLQAVHIVTGYPAGASPTSLRGLLLTLCRAASASNSSSTTGPAPAAISVRKWSLMPPQTATRCS